MGFEIMNIIALIVDFLQAMMGCTKQKKGHSGYNIYGKAEERSAATC